tara:strand:+ start:295 stop:1092 length:798 start_codon:yes stop_codon:yes gene_type:complete
MSIKGLKLVTPISHLFKNEFDANDIEEFSDELEARERTANLRFKNTTHYHIDFDLNLGISHDQKDFLKEHVKNRDEIKTLTFQLTRDTENFSISKGRYLPKGPLISEKEQLTRCKKSLAIISDIVGSQRSIGIENNNYYQTGAYEIATSANFINKVIKELKCHLLLDIAHAKVTCKNKKVNFASYISELTKDIRCKQMHLCRTNERISEYGIETYDAHLIPEKEDIKEAIKLCKDLDINNLTVEYYKDKHSLVRSLKLIKELINN